jgi:hypothetical protein
MYIRSGQTFIIVNVRRCDGEKNFLFAARLSWLTCVATTESAGRFSTSDPSASGNSGSTSLPRSEILTDSANSESFQSGMSFAMTVEVKKSGAWDTFATVDTDERSSNTARRGVHEEGRDRTLPPRRSGHAA